MAGYVYLIRNGDLHKIGRTDNLDRRLKQLQPCVLVQSLKTDRSRDLEYELHKRFKDKRIPQTEYFRLDEAEVNLVRIALGWQPDEPIQLPPLHAIHDDIAQARRSTKIAAIGIAVTLPALVVETFTLHPDDSLLQSLVFQATEVGFALSAASCLISSATYGIRWSKQKASDGIRWGWQKLNQRQD